MAASPTIALKVIPLVAIASGLAYFVWQSPPLTNSGWAQLFFAFLAGAALQRILAGSGKGR